MKKLIAIFVIILFAAGTAQGELIEFTFGGDVNGFGGTPTSPWDEVNFGDAWSLTYTFESTTSDTDPSPTFGNYPAITSWSLTVGTVTDSETAPGIADIYVSNGPEYDKYEVSLATAGPDYSLYLADETQTAFTSDALPLGGEIDLLDFSSWHFNVVRESPDYWHIHGSVTSHSWIPEPSTVLLLAFGSLALLRRRKINRRER